MSFKCFIGLLFNKTLKDKSTILRVTVNVLFVAVNARLDGVKGLFASCRYPTVALFLLSSCSTGLSIMQH